MTRFDVEADVDTGVVGRLVARERDGIARRAEPVRTGLPLPRGRVRHPDRLALRDAAGARLPLQTQVLDRWSDDSVRWLLLDFPLDLEARGEAALTLVDADAPAPFVAPLAVRSTSSGVFVDTGVVQFALDAGAAFPFRSARAGGIELLEAEGALRCTDTNGNARVAVTEAIEMECAGPYRATARLTGAFGEGDDTPLRFEARVHFHAGSATAHVELAVTNPRRAAHPGGHWELGDAGSFRFDDLSWTARVRGADRVAWSADPSTPLADAGAVSFALHQESSGGENWQSPVHRTADGTVAPRWRGYRVTVDGVERSGARATPRVVLHDRKQGLCVSMRHFWQNFPKGIEAAGGAITLRLFPGGGAAHELQGGERKTHAFAITAGRAALAGPVDAVRRPLTVRPDVATFTASRALPYLVPRTDGAEDLYERLVAAAVEGSDTFEHKRERIDEYGWRNFGDTWADHEAVQHRGAAPFVSHHNNQYDIVYGALLQFARTGDERWHAIAEDLAAHVADIDRYHTTEDKPNYNGGLFWHTAHYVDADLSTHRSYPKKGSCGGGPDNEHNYTTGLAHWYFLTGNPGFRKAALGGGDWVIRADDGGGTMLRHLDRGPTGLASKTRDFDYHGPGRGAGNSIQALLDAWRLTRDDAYLRKCVEIVRRTIHPADDIDARNLLDAENRWSYTVHLQAVGRFLDEMAEAGRLDEDYAYARAGLLAYARWMRDRERPSLDEPEKLEHPTETWAVQDLRKSEVFLFAAMHVRGEERDGFLRAAERFHEPMLEKLDSFETKTTLRPVALLMRYGLMKAWFREHPDETRPEGPAIADFGAPQVFAPQKLRAIAKLKRLVVVGGGVLVVAVGALVWWVMRG